MAIDVLIPLAVKCCTIRTMLPTPWSIHPARGLLSARVTAHDIVSSFQTTSGHHGLRAEDTGVTAERFLRFCCTTIVWMPGKGLLHDRYTSPEGTLGSEGMSDLLPSPGPSTPRTADGEQMAAMSRWGAGDAIFRGVGGRF